MAKIKGLKAKVEKHPVYKVPRRIYDIESKTSKAAPAKIAETLLKKIAPALKIKPDLSQLKFDKVKESILGKHVLYQQYHDGKPRHFRAARHSAKSPTQQLAGGCAV